MHGEGEQRILKRHDPKTPQSVQRKRLTWFLKLSTKNSLLRFNYKENVGKQSQKILKENVDKQSQNTLSEYLSSAKFFEEGFGLSRIIFTMSKLKQKELALNATEILQLKRDCTRHFIEYGRAYIHD